MNADRPAEQHILRLMDAQPPDTGRRPACRLCETLWGQCGISGWSARLMAQTYEHRPAPSQAGLAMMRSAVRRLERAGRVVTFSYPGCQGELFAAPLPGDTCA